MESNVVVIFVMIDRNWLMQAFVLTALIIKELVQIGNHADLIIAHRLKNCSSMESVSNVIHSNELKMTEKLVAVTLVARNIHLF